MAETLSPRLAEIFAALKLKPGMRVLEIGCGPGALARAMADEAGFVLGLDRSEKAIAQAVAGSRSAIDAGRLAFRTGKAEDFVLAPGEAPFDLAVAIRVGALDGRHPEAGRLARERLRAAMAPGGKLLIDGGDPLREIDLR
jgi:cyclopropane fatty-acyl-phospholipid synthase-like methyltransferase